MGLAACGDGLPAEGDLPGEIQDMTETTGGPLG